MRYRRRVSESFERMCDRRADQESWPDWMLGLIDHVYQFAPAGSYHARATDLVVAVRQDATARYWRRVIASICVHCLNRVVRIGEPAAGTLRKTEALSLWQRVCADDDPKQREWLDATAVAQAIYDRERLCMDLYTHKAVAEYARDMASVNAASAFLRSLALSHNEHNAKRNMSVFLRDVTHALGWECVQHSPIGERAFDLTPPAAWRQINRTVSQCAIEWTRRIAVFAADRLKDAGV